MEKDAIQFIAKVLIEIIIQYHSDLPKLPTFLYIDQGLDRNNPSFFYVIIHDLTRYSAQDILLAVFDFKSSWKHKPLNEVLIKKLPKDRHALEGKCDNFESKSKMVTKVQRQCFRRLLLDSLRRFGIAHEFYMQLDNNLFFCNHILPNTEKELRTMVNPHAIKYEGVSAYDILLVDASPLEFDRLSKYIEFVVCLPQKIPFSKMRISKEGNSIYRCDLFFEQFDTLKMLEKRPVIKKE